LIKKYRSKGYRVFAEHPKCTSPRSISKFKPDLIVKKGNQTIIIEVKTKKSIKANKKVIISLAAYAKKRPNVRFDLAITNPKSPQKTS